MGRSAQPDTIRGQLGGAAPIAWRLDGPAASADLPLVLALHGRGQSEDDFAHRLRGLCEGAIRLLLPRGPLSLPSERGDSVRASWYDYDGDQPRFRTELERCEATLLALLGAVESERGLRPRRRWLLGFSQGGYCGSWLALRNAELFDGMAIVGARVKTEWLAEAMSDAASHGFRALLCHGTRDRAVLPAAAERSRAGLAAAGVPVQLQWLEAGHSLDAEAVKAIAAWLAEGDSGSLDTGMPLR